MRLKNLARNFARQALKVIPPETTVRILSGRLRGKKWIINSYIHKCWLGTYELKQQNLFCDTVKPQEVFFDIGANVGFYTLLSSVLVGEQGQVIAFEPGRRCLNYLRKHLLLNDVKNVRVVEAAVTDFCGTINFSETSDGENGAISNASQNGDHTRAVRAIALDEAIRNRELPIPSKIKIDVEGAEATVLNGARELLQQFRPTIFLSTHGLEVYQNCCRQLRECGYEVTVIEGSESLNGFCEIIARPVA